jgi:hypothetical protein
MSEETPSKGPSPSPFILLVLTLLVVIVFLGFLLTATDGHFVPQVTDLYVVCQYAKAMAEGHPFQYNRGEPPSTGSTSLLHTSLLALGHRVGFRGEGLVAFAILLGAALYVASVARARRIGILLAGEREGLLAGSLVALCGPVVWGFLYGSDIALFMFLALWLFEALLLNWSKGSAGGIAVPGGLLALARPEGLLVGLVLGAGWSLGLGRRARGFARVLPWLPACIGVGVLCLYRSLTGFWLGTSVRDKSLLANYGLADSVSLVAQYLVDVTRGLLMGFYPSDTVTGFSRGWAPFYFPPLTLILVLVALARAPEAFRAPLRLWMGLVVSLMVLLSPTVFMGVHFNRYLMWAFPTFDILAAVGLGALTGVLARADSRLETSLFRGGAFLAVALGALSTLTFASHYGSMAGQVYRRDVAAARWISANLPPGAAMANIATSVEYLTGHRNMNLHGVTSPAFFGNRTGEREAGVFEAFGRLPPSERPPFLITSISAQDSYPTLRELVSEPPLYRTSSFSDEILIYKMRYDLVGKNGRLFLPETLRTIDGLQEVDRLNICDSRDEAAHAYRYWSRLGDLRLQGTVRIASYELPSGPELVADGGRAILGGESFRVRAARGKDLVVVLRTANSVSANILRAGGSGQFGVEFPEAGIIVGVDGRRLSLRPRSGWEELVFRIPGHFLGTNETLLELTGNYASFYYWFFQ